MVHNHHNDLGMCLEVTASSPLFDTAGPAAGAGRFGGQRSPENGTSPAAEVGRDRSHTASQEQAEVRAETVTFLSAGQLLGSRSSDLRQPVFPRTAWILKLTLLVTCGASRAVRRRGPGGGDGGLTHLALGRRDGHQLEQPLDFGVGVEGLEGVLSRRLNLSGVGAPLEPAAKERRLPCTGTAPWSPNQLQNVITHTHTHTRASHSEVLLYHKDSRLVLQEKAPFG